MLETLSRLRRRMEAQVADGRNIPSFPSMSGFDDYGITESLSSPLAEESLELDLTCSAFLPVSLTPIGTFSLVGTACRYHCKICSGVHEQDELASAGGRRVSPTGRSADIGLTPKKKNHDYWVSSRCWGVFPRKLSMSYSAYFMHIAISYR
jgi:hypothetical protein